jgi:hypothetical protein
MSSASDQHAVLAAFSKVLARDAHNLSRLETVPVEPREPVLPAHGAQPARHHWWGHG